MSHSPSEMADLIRLIVAGEDIDLAGLFAADGVLRFPFAAPGAARELHGRAAIQQHFAGTATSLRKLLRMDGVDLLVHRTDDPEVVVCEIEHHGHAMVLDAPYRFRAVVVLRVRDGEIVSCDDYTDPIAAARLFGRIPELVAALTGS